MPTIKIFRAGTHVSSSGQPITIRSNDLDNMTQTYNRLARKSPIVLGHPIDDQPVYGYITSLQSKGGELFAEAGNIHADLVTLVRRKMFNKVSAAFHPPFSRNNPTPGLWALKHVGMLGAMPPSVKGLGNVSFADVGVQRPLPYFEFPIELPEDFILC